jgi:hypothetical protein
MNKQRPRAFSATRLNPVGFMLGAMFATARSIQASFMFSIMAAVAPVAPAGVVFLTNFEGATQTAVGAQVVHNGTVSNGYTVSDFTKGSGINSFKLDTSVAGDLFISEAAGTNPATNLAQAVAANAYFEFIVTASEGTDFSKLDFSMRGVGSTSNGYVTVRSSVDNYSSNLGTVSGAMTNKYSTSVNLLAASGFTNRSQVTFRFYIYDEYSGQNNRRIGIDDIELSVVSRPVPTCPANGSASYQTIPYFQWTDVIETPFPGTYQIQIAGDSSFSNILDEDEIPALINHYVPAMEFNPQVLYWRVRYTDECGYAASWTMPQALEIKAMPRVFTVSAGANWDQIQSELTNALANTPCELRFDPGVYQVTRDPADTAFFHIQSKGNILINGQGCEFVITDQAGTRCDFFYGRGATGPVQFKNFTVDYAPNSLSHFGGQVINIEKLSYPSCAFTIRPDPVTYPSPDPILTNKLGVVLEPGTLQRWYASDADPRFEVNETIAQAAANSLLGPGTYRFTPKNNLSYFYDHLKTNHWFILPERGGDLFYVYQNCPDLVINNVTSKACRGRAFIPRKACERLRVVNNSILRTGNRVLGMTSGGINDHAGAALTNWFPWWEGNTLEYNADDMYNGNNDRAVFRNNILRGPFRNAIWLHHDRQWVEGNTVEYAGTRGLTMTPGGLYEDATNEICYVVNTAQIRNNLFIQPRLNGLQMGSDTNLPCDSSGDYYHTDITFQDNIWVDYQKYEGLLIEYGKRITLLDNWVTNTSSCTNFAYENDPARAKGVYIDHSDEVFLMNNYIEDTRISETNRIVIGPYATNIVIDEP